MIALHCMELWNTTSKASCWVFGCVFFMEARQRSTVATCSHIGTRLAEARLNEHKVLHCPYKSSWSTSQKTWWSMISAQVVSTSSPNVFKLSWHDVDKCFLQIWKYLQYKRSWFLRHENLLSSVGGFALRISPNFKIKRTHSLLQIVSNCWCLLILMAEQSSRKKQLHRQFNFRDLFQENLRSEIVSNLSIHTPRGFLPGRFSGFLQNGRHPIRFEMWKSGKIWHWNWTRFCISLQ